MLNVQTADTIVSTVTFILAYVLCATIVGAIAAWVIALLGDRTAQSQGMTSLNPLVHVDPVGFLCFYLTGLGWFSRIPINVSHFDPPLKRLKIFAAFTTESVLHIIFATLSIIGLTAYFGSQIFVVSLPMLARYEYLSHRMLTAAYPQLPSFIIVLAFLIISFIYINVMLATLSLLFNFCRYIIDVIITHSSVLAQQTFLIRFLLPLAIVIIFAGPLRLMITKLICIIGLAFGKYLCTT